MDKNRPIGQQIKARRNQLGLTQSELAEKIGIQNVAGKTIISKYENGTRSANEDTLLKIAGALNCRLVKEVYLKPIEDQ